MGAPLEGQMPARRLQGRFQRSLEPLPLPRSAHVICAGRAILEPLALGIDQADLQIRRKTTGFDAPDLQPTGQPVSARR